MQYMTLLQELLISSAKLFPDKIALIIDKRKYSYSDLLFRAAFFSNTLKKNGFKRFDRVVIHAGNSIRTVEAFWGALMADGIVSIVSPDVTEKKLNYILQDTEAKVQVSEHSVKIFSNHSSFKIMSEKEKGNGDNLDFDFKNHELDLASIIYTSGSTGEPKGVMMTHRNMLAATFSINRYLKHNSKDVILCALPLSFDYGLYQMIMAFSVGATLVLEKDTLFAARLLHKIEREKVTILPGVPTLFSLLAEHAEHFQYNYSSLRAITNTGAALTEKHILEISSLFKEAELFSMYGLTECKRCTYLPPHALKRKPGSVGVAIPNTEIWIVDEQGQKVGPGVVGQLVVRGATVMRGYWKKPEESTKKLKEGPLPGEKVLYTGDYALLDSENYLYFRGRIDEMIKFKGVKISPIEIEEIVCTLPEIREAAVLNISEPCDDSKLIVCVSLTRHFEKYKLESKIRQALPSYQRPTHVFVFQSLPKNSNGKIDKSDLIKQITNEFLKAG